MMNRIRGRLFLHHIRHHNNNMERNRQMFEDGRSDDITVDDNLENNFELNDSSGIVNKMARLYETGIMSDLVLIVCGVKYHVHRAILCASSDVFQVMLTNPNFNESQQSEIRLTEDADAADAFADMLKYLYTGSISVSHTKLLSVLILADKYNVQDLVRQCTEYMCDRLVFAAQQNLLVGWLQHSIVCHHDLLTDACLNYLKWNFAEISTTPQYGELDQDVLVYLLKQDDLVIHDEALLYDCVVSWLQYQKQKLETLHYGDGVNSNHDAAREDSQDVDQALQTLVVEVMSYVRFSMMSPRQLADLLLVDMTITYKDFFLERMAMGMSFHSGHWDRLKDMPDVMFRPRIYTCQSWCDSLIVDNYRLVESYSTRTLVFTTPNSLSDYDQQGTVEWVVDVYPRGVWFQKFKMIVMSWEMIDVPEAVLRTVRLSVMPRELGPKQVVRVRIAVLISGVTHDFEHTRHVVCKNCVFTEQDRVINIDDLLSFEELNDPIVKSPFLVGKDRNMLKLRIVVLPVRTQFYGDL